MKKIPDFREFEGEAPENDISNASYYLGDGICGRPEIGECNPDKCKKVINNGKNDPETAALITNCRIAVDNWIEAYLP